MLLLSIVYKGNSGSLYKWICSLTNPLHYVARSKGFKNKKKGGEM